MRGSWLLVVVAACKAASSSPTDRGDLGDAGAPVAATFPRPIGENQVDVIVANERYTTISEQELITGARLDAIVAHHPLGSWTSITVRGKDVGPTTILKPSENYPNTYPRVFFDARTRRASFGLMQLDGNLSSREDGIDEIRIELAPDEPTPLEALSAGCQRPRKGDEKPPNPPRRFRGDAYQFNTNTPWYFDLQIELGAHDIGDHVGTLYARGRYGSYLTVDCISDLYRAADRGGQRVVTERVRSGACVDGTIAFACSDSALKLKAFYLDGQYVLYGALAPDP